MNFIKSLMIVLMSFMMVILSCQKGDNLTIDIEVEKLISQMTLEEKIGQMTQLTIDSVSKVKSTVAESHQIDPVKLEEAIVEYHIGSILNVYDAAYTLDHWHEIITQIQDIATKKTRLGIPIIYGIDAIHGANYIIGATIFPQSIGMAATWNPELVRKGGEITAIETRASGVPWNFNPVLGLGRQPLWPRLFETYGEDVYLASVMGAEYVKGLQGD
ncbi:MAG: glycoside hydrolase family 3 protein, partial [Candidatus Marinimicrobia bacterium]|nr:glycoside hydrolase family 3 protein [Candidatus Neomarinimicrobiota bacterium]